MQKTLAVLAILGRSLAHSWAEQLSTIVNGTFVGEHGYPRGYMPRSTAFKDEWMTHLLPPHESGRLRADDTDILCAPTQRSYTQTAGFPRLQVTPGSYVAIKYLENGHVTMPEVPPGKPPGGGKVFVYGTGQSEPNEALTNVLRWTADGSGGDRKGLLLTAQDYDDGRCYQINDSEISRFRQQEFPNTGSSGERREQWCETDVKIPANVSVGSVYTIYWIWRWPTSETAPGMLDVKDEYYVTCSDLDIVTSPLQTGKSKPLLDQDPQRHAHKNYKSRASQVLM